MPTTTDYRKSEEWQSAERAMTAMLGFRVTKMDGAVERRGTPAELKHDDSFLLQHVDQSPELKTRSTRPTDKAMWDLWLEAIRQRIDGQGACALAWRLYSAATGLTLGSFNGMPAGQPEDHVKQLRRDYLEQEQALDKALTRARDQLTAAGLCWQCAPPYRETVGMVCQVCGRDYGVPDNGHAPATP